ncbi:MAG: ABC transporter substrate-binding protein [Promicromonosporaceae bacterium]|nr:ABC transporter substrate-binding protein [Promicromonosporaceae bacterium]
MWGPPVSWNPIPFNGGATGTQGLIYETLFHFNLDTFELVPWLASSGEWIDDNTYTLTLRDNIYWTDGVQMTPEDVVFTFEMGKLDGVSWGVTMWYEDPLLDSITTSGQDITFHFANPRVQTWENILYTRPIMPQHIMGDWTVDELMMGQNENPVGSGPFTLFAAGQDRVTYERNDNWWGIQDLGMSFPMRFIVDIVNSSNEVALGLLQQGQLDISNNFLPGINTLVDRGVVTTYFPTAPYMLSANTAVLIPNTEREPMNDPAFRRALAESINIDLIVQTAFGNLVQPASPTGLLPVFDSFVNQDLVNQYGFTFDTAQARQTLLDAGYTLGSDGYFQNLDGTPIDLELIVPSGWTDWMDAAQLISESAADAGIHITVAFPDAPTLDDRRAQGDFDLVINNWSQVSNSPWNWWNYVYWMPIADNMWSGNWGRFDDGGVAFDNVLAMGSAHQGSADFTTASDNLQTIMLQELPMIPMWYNGLWAQFTENYWTNWPSVTNPTGWPSTWAGYWEMGGLNALANLQPVN